MNTTLPSVQVYGADNKVVFPDDITIVDNNTVKVNFARAVTGRAIILSGTRSGSNRPTYAYEHTQTTLSNTWVVPHNLGYNPIVRIFVGNAEVQPMSIVHDSLFQCTISFTQQYVGIARLI
jgi:hypothetical protein